MDNIKKLIVIDGNSLLFRAYYATAWGENPSIMRTKDGTPTNAIFALANMLTKILSSLKGGESIFVGFDSDKQTFRKEEFADYKANRRPCPEDLIPQFPISRELLDCLGILHYEVHGLEADDLCGTMAKIASAKGYQVEVYTSDKDYLQLIDNNITVNLLKTGLSNMERMDEENMLKVFGFAPKQIIDFKGLKGDPSDNLPGIPGVGDKTAVSLIQEYGSFDKIIEAAQTMTSKLGEKIRTNEKQGRLCYELAKIKTDCELPFTLEDALYEGYEFNKINEFSQKYEFRQLVNRLPVAFKKGSLTAFEFDTKEVESFEGISIANQIGLYADVESDYHTSIINGIALSSGQNTYYISAENAVKDSYFKQILLDSNTSKYIFDVKAFNFVLNRLGLKINGIKFDPLLAAYILDSSSSFTPRGVFSSFGIDLGEANSSSLSLFSTKNIDMSGKIAFYSQYSFSKAINDLKENDALKLFNEIELPLASVLADMEIEGFPADKELLTEIGNKFKEKVTFLESEIKTLAGSDFNISSPKQVAKVLFEDLHLKDLKGGSTSVEVLTSLIDDHPIIPLILEHRKYTKLVGTYTDGLIPHITKGYIHTYFNQAQTATGRLSSSNPNLQNISTRDEEGRMIKKAFYYSEPNMNILSFDYGQIELRILASLANCQDYKDIFQTERDVHSETAKKIFGVDEPTTLQRRKAKAVNFAIIYGTTIYGLAEQIQTSPKEAGEIINNFYSSYPELRDYLDSIIDSVERQGYVTTMFGRRRYLRDITDPNYNKREAAKRAALNAPVQGSAADLIKIAMLKVAAFLKENSYKTRMVLQIHDELIFKVPDDEINLVLPKIKDIMEHAVDLPVKLTVEPGIGKTWYDAKE